jgi:hypothetical protein
MAWVGWPDAQQIGAWRFGADQLTTPMPSPARSMVWACSPASAMRWPESFA